MRAQTNKPVLLRTPTLSRTHIAFSYGGNIWIANHAGQDLRRLTTAGHEFRPAFSPDGTEVAFTGEYGGARGVFVVPVDGGAPRQLTYHAADLGVWGVGEMLSWTPDGARILFSSRRASFTPSNPMGGVRLFTIPASGGAVTAVPLARAAQGVYSPDSRQMAYVPHVRSQSECKRYRGGQAQCIWIADLSDSSIAARIPQERSNDFNPMWVGETIYFLSDRAGPVTLFAYDLKSREIRQIVKNDGFDIKSAAALSDTIAYEQFGSLHLLDLKSGRDRALDILPVADFPEVRPRVENFACRGVTEGPYEKIKPRLSPSGVRAILSVHGRIVTIPAEKGDIRVLTQASGVAEREPAWSPDGQSIAYFSDESGEYALHVRDQRGLNAARKIDLDPTHYYSPSWSPDSKKIAYSDKRLNYWYVDLERGQATRIDTDLFVAPRGGHDLQLAWSPDSRWIAYTKRLPSHLQAIFVYSIEQSKSYQLTDGTSDARDVAFDRGGQYLYFTASTDAALATGWMDMLSFGRQVSRGAYVMLLRKEASTPFSIESDEETGLLSTDLSRQISSTEKTAQVGIDFDGLGDRIIRLPLPARNYYGLWAGREGVVFLTEGPPVEATNAGQSLTFYPSQKIHRFDLHTRRAEQILEDVGYFDLSFDGARMLYARQQGHKRQWFIAAAQKGGDSGQGALRIDNIDVFVDPRTEWKHMYEEAWRQERDFFYDPGLHGLNLEQARKTYEPFLDHIVTREELDYLFNEMLGNLTCSHMLAVGGEAMKFKPSTTGLLGADYSVEKGRYRFARILAADPWNPAVRAPLREPGKSVHVGEYLLSVNGREISAAADVFSHFSGTVGKQVTIKVGPSPEGNDSRELVVIPIDDESPLRYFAWVEKNRRQVEEATQGRVAYVHLPDMTFNGYTAFNRQFFAQVGKEAVIIDDRYNSGGSGADYIIECLRRPLLNYWHTREGRDCTGPQLGIFGPKVMLINEMSSSMGERFPWSFRKLGIGPLIGTRTWGGLVGTYGNPPEFLDGGFIMTPNLAFYGEGGAWEVENDGVSPDVEVEDDPKLARKGRDPQLERGIEVVMDLLKRNPSPSVIHQHPPYPIYGLPVHRKSTVDE